MKIDEYDKIVALLVENHFVETSPYETIKHLIETHQDYKEGEMKEQWTIVEEGKEDKVFIIEIGDEEE